MPISYLDEKWPKNQIELTAASRWPKQTVQRTGAAISHKVKCERHRRLTPIADFVRRMLNCRGGISETQPAGTSNDE